MFKKPVRAKRIARCAREVVPKGRSVLTASRGLPVLCKRSSLGQWPSEARDQVQHPRAPLVAPESESGILTLDARPRSGIRARVPRSGSPSELRESEPARQLAATTLMSILDGGAPLSRLSGRRAPRGLASSRSLPLRSPRACAPCVGARPESNFGFSQKEDRVCEVMHARASSSHCWRVATRPDDRSPSSASLSVEAIRSCGWERCQGR